MGKLFALKEWVTLDEACAFLSASLSEEVTIADLYRLALGRHLKLSVHFVNHARARIGRKMLIRDAGFSVFPAIKQKGDVDEPLIIIGVTRGALKEYEAWLTSSPEHSAMVTADEPRHKSLILNGNQVSDTECLNFSEDVVSIDGIWDLPIAGAERLDVEHALQQEVGGPPVELIHLDGAYVFREDGLFAWLQERFSANEFARESQRKKGFSDPTAYFPAGGLPIDAPIVVRPAELSRFLATLADPEAGRDEKPLQARERNNLLHVIRALVEMASLPDRGYAESIRAQLDTLGLSAPSDDTIRKLVGAARKLNS